MPTSFWASCFTPRAWSPGYTLFQRSRWSPSAWLRPSCNCMEVEGGHSAMQPFEDEVTGRFKCCAVLNGRSHFAIDENMSVARLRAKSSGEIHDCADRAIVAAALEAY